MKELTKKLCLAASARVLVVLDSKKGNHVQPIDFSSTDDSIENTAWDAAVIAAIVAHNFHTEGDCPKMTASGSDVVFQNFATLRLFDNGNATLDFGGFSAHLMAGEPVKFEGETDEKIREAAKIFVDEAFSAYAFLSGNKCLIS